MTYGKKIEAWFTLKECFQSVRRTADLYFLADPFVYVYTYFFSYIYPHCLLENNLTERKIRH